MKIITSSRQEGHRIIPSDHCSIIVCKLKSASRHSNTLHSYAHASKVQARALGRVITYLNNTTICLPLIVGANERV